MEARGGGSVGDAEFPSLMSGVGDGARVPIAPQRNEVFDAKGKRVKRARGEVELRSVRGPDVELPTGRLVVVDPSAINDPETRALARRVEPGQYRTQMLVAGEPIEGCVAFGVVWVRNETPRRFVPAPREDEAGEKLGPGEVFAVGTDYALVSFLDAAMCEAWHRSEESGTNLALWTRIDEQMQDRRVGELRVDGIGAAVLLSSGFGDGVYGKAWGVDERGEAVCLVVDLDVVETSLPEGASG